MGLATVAKRFVQGKHKTEWDVVRTWIPAQSKHAIENRESGALVLSVPLVQTKRAFWGYLARRMKAAELKEFELDAVGSFVWDHIDGKRSVGELAGELKREFKLHRLEAETALSAFIEMLDRRGLIEWQARQESSTKASKQTKKR